MKEQRPFKPGSLAGGAIMFVALCLCTITSTQAADTWQNEIAIYGWLAGIDGTTKFPAGSGPDTSVDASEILDNLNMIFMGGYEGKYGKWSIITDLIYMDIGGSADKPLLLGAKSVDLDIKSWIVNAGVGYELVQSDRGTLSVVGGVRYLGLDVDVNLGIMDNSLVERSGSDGMVDGIIGMRGYLSLSDKWYLPYYADIGAGSSELTWQLFGGVGYRFGWGDIRLGYRYLSYDLDDHKVMEDLKLSGPLLGVGFKF
jgi:hypothetical protein